MNKNVLIVLVGGFLIAVLVAIMLQSALSGKKTKKLDDTIVQVLVSAKDLKVGHELIAGDLKWQDWPKDNVFKGAIVRKDQQATMDAIEGKLLRPIASGQPMHMSLVVEDDKGDFLSANVTKGMRAVGISVKSHVLSDRLVRPGDYVDVMVTYRVRVNTKTVPEAQSLVNRYATETVIENVRVLAVDKDDTKAVDEEEGDGKKKKSKSSKSASLTLEVTPEGAEKLVLADKMGSIGIALRSIGDTQNPENDQSTTDVGMSKVMTKLSNMSGVGPKSSVVRIYSGDNMQEVRARSEAQEQEQSTNVEFSVDDPPEEPVDQIETIQELIDEIR